ncbi:hypothetical protein NLU13_7296 [Sarocladium strictum]|uniref:Uncharacterized protein n=1 Tax=Sarocladium strictum TaxID=5046 RepID=A0AA39GCI9_SARSR|nr:hypothetical protein NLU13_7296 [Sarocladium strictum]
MAHESHLFPDPPEGVIDVPKEYDPEFLRHLRQPRPRDQPSDLPESFFTFDDALQDLMAAHFNGQILDIHAMAAQRLLLRYKYPEGEPTVEQVFRWSGFGTFKIRRHNSILYGPIGACMMLNPQTDVYHLTVLDGTGMPTNGFFDLEANVKRGKIHWPGADAFPSHELELAEETSKHSSNSWWPSPFDTLWSLVGGRKADGDDGLAHGEAGHVSTSESTRVNVDENGATEEKITERVDDQGRKTTVVLERKFDPQGNVISERTRRFEDGKEKDVYEGL